MGAYIVLATNGALEWRPFNLPYQVWISTGNNFSEQSDISFFKKSAFQKRTGKIKKMAFDHDRSRRDFYFFADSRVVSLLYRRGVYWEANPYAGFFYILTAVHVVHVLGGICALGAIVLRTWNKTFSFDELEYRQNLANVVGWYWHFMDALWIVILFLLGFWK